MKKSIQKSEHLTHPYLLNPQHKVTINLIGAGGTGSQVLSGLCKLNKGIQAMGHTGIHVRLYDFDIVSEANIGRQLFSPTDLGLNKAISSITRVNRYFGYDWEAQPNKFDHDSEPFNITITCIDNAEGRIKIAKALRDDLEEGDEPFNNKHYWLDFGNARFTGQAVLGTINEKPENSLPIVTELFDLSKIKEVNQGPSCSLAEAIGRQDLYINPILADFGCDLLWKLFTNGKLLFHGVYVNLQSIQVRPIPVPIYTHKKFKK